MLGVFVFLIPAPALAVDHSESKTSAPEDAGLVVVLLDAVLEDRGDVKPADIEDED